MVIHRLEKDVYIEAPAERVWRAVTEPAQLAVWYAFGGVELDLRPGGRLVLRWAEHGTFHGIVEAVEPGTRLAYRYAVDPDVEPVAGNSNLVEFTITPDGTGTRLRVVESGFDQLDGNEKERAQRLAESTEGWDGGLTALVVHAAGLPAA